MTKSKQNLSDLLRQEAKPNQTKQQPAATKTGDDKLLPESSLSRMTKAQLLEHIEGLTQQLASSANTVQPEDNTATLTQTIEQLEATIAQQQQAIAQAKEQQDNLEKQLITAQAKLKVLGAEASGKAKLEQQLAEQKKLVEKLYSEIQTLQAASEPEEPQPAERTVNQDKELALARVASYQVNLQFSHQPNHLSEEDIGWFD